MTPSSTSQEGAASALVLVELLTVETPVVAGAAAEETFVMELILVKFQVVVVVVGWFMLILLGCMPYLTQVLPARMAELLFIIEKL